MSQKIVVGPIDKGLRTDRLPFNIDNDSFPTLVNAYQWRGRIKRKRGTALLGQVSRFFNSNNKSYVQVGTNKTGTLPYTITLSSGAGNLITGTYSSNDGSPVTFTLSSLAPNASIIPGSVTLLDTTASQTYTEPVTPDGTLVGSSGGTGIINYATGAITIASGASDKIQAQFRYYPTLPILGLEDLVLSANLFPGTLAFDDMYSYNILTMPPFSIYDVSFYKNPAANTYASNPKKTVTTPTTWNGNTYQQFWSANYESAFWVTNGVDVPFTGATIGMQFAPSTSISFNSQTGTTIVVVITNCPLVIGDFVFVNEWTASSAANAATLNFQTGYVTATSGTYASLTVTITFPSAAIATDTYTPGIIQYLTNRSNTTIDCIRFYDGDPTNGNPTAPTLTGVTGWVNFMPPISQGVMSIGDLPAAQYYLVGCVAIVPYKDRLLFIGPVVQKSSASTVYYLQDTIIYSQNGTPYYTASFSGSVSSATTTFTPMITPANQSAAPNAYFADVAGFGGFITAGHARPLLSAGFNEDVLILGFSNRQTRLLYTGNDLVPFNFFTVNSEFGTTATFSSVTLDRAVLSIGNNGIIATSQIGAERIDLEILDQIFQFNLNNNGTQRITAQRDFINEWIYFTYCMRETPGGWVFPNQTLQYNYRERSWAIFNESYTTYGPFKESGILTWAAVGKTFPTWESWNEPWNSGSTNDFQPKVIAGNQQGYIFFRDEGTAEPQSLNIQSYTGNVITSPNHNLNDGDYITITINGTLIGVFQVENPTSNVNTFMALGPTLPGSYFGLGTIQRMYVPFVQTKQFPVSWGMARKTRIGPQQYLLSTTAAGQITLLIFLSTSSESYNNIEFPLPVEIIPSVYSQNDSLVYSTVLYTCPESTNLGLTPSNINLQMLTAQQQAQIWHRMNTSLIGDVVQLGFTLNESQMLDPNLIIQFSEIELHAMIIEVSPSMVLA